MKAWIRILTALLPLVGLVVFALFVSQFGPLDRRYLRLIREDGIVEYATAPALFIAGASYALLAWRLASMKLRLDAALAVAFALVFLWIGLEEISYGQRLLGFGTPTDLTRINRQKEFNLHNVTAIEWFTLKMGPLIMAAYGLLALPVALVLRRTGLSLMRNLTLFAPPLHAVPWFLPIAFYVRSQYGPNFVWQHQEPAEFAMAVALMLLGLSAVRQSASLGKSDARAARATTRPPALAFASRPALSTCHPDGQQVGHVVQRGMTLPSAR